MNGRDWPWATLDEVATITAGNPAPQGAEFFDGGDRPFVRVQDLGRLNGASHVNETADLLNCRAAAKLKLFPKGSVLFTKSGASLLLNQRAILGRDMYVVSHIGAAVPGPRVTSEWLYFWLRTVDFADIAHGANMPSLPLARVKRIRIPVPPILEQRERVAEIEKQFSRLDEAVANLKRVNANLKRYKAAVLKAAVEGGLVPTEADLARHEGRSYETGGQVLQSVLQFRREHWRGRGKYREPSAPDITNLPMLPEGWCWSTFNAVADRVTVGHVGPMKDEYVEYGVPFLRSQNVRANCYDPAGLKFISPEFHAKLKKSSLRPGDIVVVRSGSVGVSCVIPDTLPTANCSDLVIIKGPHGILSHFAAYYLNAVVESRIAAGRVGVALVHFNTRSVADLPIPVPPLAEQARIVADVARRLSFVSEVEIEIGNNLCRARSLGNVILNQQLEGQLSAVDTSLVSAS